jgi:RimJ/RimL family protein N-acetyltransferase
MLDGKRHVTYWIGREFWGNGIATDALHRLLRVIHDRPIYATAKDNVASIRVLEKCGFLNCGSGRAFARERGTEIEEVFFELTVSSEM